MGGLPSVTVSRYIADASEIRRSYAATDLITSDNCSEQSILRQQFYCRGAVYQIFTISDRILSLREAFGQKFRRVANVKILPNVFSQ